MIDAEFDRELKGVLEEFKYRAITQELLYEVVFLVDALIQARYPGSDTKAGVRVVDDDRLAVFACPEGMEPVVWPPAKAMWDPFIVEIRDDGTIYIYERNFYVT